MKSYYLGQHGQTQKGYYAQQHKSDRQRHRSDFTYIQMLKYKAMEQTKQKQTKIQRTNWWSPEGRDWGLGKIGKGD